MNIDLFEAPENTLTTLSFGGGQDSSVLLEMYIENHNGFRERFAPNDFIVVMADTGDEFKQTYLHVAECQKRCESEGIPFFFITKDMGYHSQSWLSLTHFYRTKKTIGSSAFPSTCTDRLKIQPIYNFLEDYLSEKYGVQKGRKKGFYEFAKTYGKISMLIGFAAKEEKRVGKTDPNVYRNATVEKHYPLIELGYDRAACQDFLHKRGMEVMPSNCKRCHYMSKEEIEYMRRFFPEDLDEWIYLEQAKIDNNTHKNAVIVTDKKGKKKVVNKNLGVYGKKLLPQVILEAKEKFQDWSDERIVEYRYSHGHCVPSSY
jgi:3'-phosphoadenosine 5'-phosphosulfate sulfotransferase (PAPS reductase)/FAD synthetase